MNRRLDRKLVALAAAYAVALNILLPVLGSVLPPAARSGALGWAALCSAPGAASHRGAAEQSPPARPEPVGPEPLCPCGAACAMPGCAATVLPGDALIGTSVPPANVTLAGLRQDDRPVQAFWPGGSKLARGPPIG
jgi:hypothetical protein